MDEKTQDDLRSVGASRYNFKIEIDDTVVYHVFFLKKIYTYFHENFSDFVGSKDVVMYCAQFNTETHRLRKGGFVFQMPMREREFVRQWTVDDWITFIKYAHNRDIALADLERITKARKDSAASKDLKKLAKERSQKLKKDIKEYDKGLTDLYSSVRSSSLEKAIFNRNKAS